jgi:hypothetical protein
MITLLDKLKTIVLQFANLHDKLNLIDEDDIKTLEESVIYISELEKERDKYKGRCEHYERCIMQMRKEEKE